MYKSLMFPLTIYSKTILVNLGVTIWTPYQSNGYSATTFRSKNVEFLSQNGLEKLGSGYTQYTVKQSSKRSVRSAFLYLMMVRRIMRLRLEIYQTSRLVIGIGKVGRKRIPFSGNLKEPIPLMTMQQEDCQLILSAITLLTL